MICIRRTLANLRPVVGSQVDYRVGQSTREDSRKGLDEENSPRGRSGSPANGIEMIIDERLIDLNVGSGSRRKENRLAARAPVLDGPSGRWRPPITRHQPLSLARPFFLFRRKKIISSLIVLSSVTQSYRVSPCPTGF